MLLYKLRNIAQWCSNLMAQKSRKLSTLFTILQAESYAYTVNDEANLNIYLYRMITYLSYDLIIHLIISSVIQVMNNFIYA